jgi:CBS domain-containing protein
MPRSTRVRQTMTTDVVTLRPDDPVQEATAKLLDRGVNGAPVVGPGGEVIGMLTTDDLLVQETRLHYPTVISLFGAYLELPSSHRHFEEELRKAVAARVGEVMSDEPVVCAPDDTLERAATLMHEHNRSRLPVVEAGRLVGIISRGDILRAIVDDRGRSPS